MNSKSGYKGVWLDRRRERWIAQITILPKPTRITKHLGYFVNVLDAVAAYKEAEEIYFGEYAPNGTK